MSRERQPGDMSQGSQYAVVFLFFLTVALAAANLLFTSHLVHNVDANKASITQLCQAQNGARTRQLQLWTFLLTLSPPPPHETAAAKVQRLKAEALLLGYIHRTFALRNCQKGGI